MHLRKLPITSIRHAWRNAAFGLGVVSVCASFSAFAANADGARVAELADLSFEQLREVVVTTVSRFEERLDKAAASVYVISAETIRRSGATTLAEALRLAPTLGVARADANQYAISARGFNNVLANKMLVLIDGRTVYTPLFSGVFWEAQDVVLTDVERIEVVTGPSTALWGSNAVNGLIHIITRSSAETVGFAGQVSVGNRDRGTALRYGRHVGDKASFRIYAKSYDRDGTRRADASAVNDGAKGVQLGFRADWAGPGESLSVQGDTYHGKIDQLPAARRIEGANLTARWERILANGGAASVQAYVDQTYRDHPASFRERLTTLDIAGQYSMRPLSNHLLVLGGGLRQGRDRVETGAQFGFVPGSVNLNWSRLFAQDVIDLSPRLALTLSGSIERNPYTGTEFLPGARLAWQVAEDHLLWSAMSRAVRAPSRIDRDFVQPAQPPYVLRGSPDFRSEVSDTIEFGYRAQISRPLSYSATLFYHRHRDLRSIMPSTQGAQLVNGIEGSTRGFELWSRWRPSERWRLDAGLVGQRVNLRVKPGQVDAGGLAALGNDPSHYASLRSSLDLTQAWSWDISLRRVGALSNPVVPAYTSVDSRVGWKMSPGVELSLVMQNIGDPGHPEWGAAASRAEFERSVLLLLRWRL